MKKRILITGSRGFVGRHLIKKLKGYEVITYDLEDDQDILDIDSLKKIKNIDIVCHLAGKTFVPECEKSPYETLRINVFGTLNILEFCRMNNARIIFPSSNVYDVFKKLPLKETDKINPINIYLKSKALCEKFIQLYNEHYKIGYVILRPSNVYGPGQIGSFLIPGVISMIRNNKKVVLNDGVPKRDFLFIKDFIDACLKAIEFKDNGIFNIGYGKSYSVREIVDKLIDVSGKDIKVKYLNKKRKNEIMDIYYDISKARKILKWKPMISIDRGLNITYHVENS